MAEFLIANMAPIMFAALVVALLIGYPVAFSLAFVGLAFAVLGMSLGLFPAAFLQALPGRVWAVLSNETLLAVPFFTFMGIVLEKSGMAEDLLETVGQLFGPVRGGLAYAVIFVGALLAATTGVVAASVIAMGLISLPIMLRTGYDRRLASGVIAAAGTLAQIIPPSLVLIVMADQLQVDVGAMYKGAMVPGLMMAGLYAVYVFIVTLVKPSAAPALPPDPHGAGFDGRHPGRALLVTLAAVFAVAGGAALTAGGASGALLGAAPEEASTLATAAFAGALVVALLLLTGLYRRLVAAPRIGALLLIATVAVFAVYCVGWVERRFPGMHADNAAIWGVAIAVVVAYLLAIANSRLGLGLFPSIADRAITVLVPPLALIFLVLGTIFLGIATPTEGGAMGAVGALALAAAKGRLSRGLIGTALDQTVKLSAFVLFILIGSRVFSLTFYGVDGHEWVASLLTNLPGGQLGFLVVVNLIVFLLAFFLDFFELAFIVVPLLAVAATALGIDLVWFGVLLGINMQTSFMHPPFGFSLFYLRSVAPRQRYVDRITGRPVDGVTTGQIYWGAIPFVLIQVAMIGIVIAFPGIVSRDRPVAVDPSRPLEIPAVEGLGGELNFGAPPPGLEQPPQIAPPPAAPDLSQPPL